MSGAGFIPHRQCMVASGECFMQGRCLQKCNPSSLHGLSPEQLLIMAAQAQRKAVGQSSRIAVRIDQMVQDVRRGAR
ncbi:hypothetical protein [Stenotrophomonas sp. GD03937]|uniref:hypothetical protein n=1 Tax=Stenotrophomonas sp. GD03937 TaxID=2975408 RepID=UPI002448B8D4|nr:hypothetical protein [Stenotrophomonas sp. GD03937]MDH1274553.1 hypothetical protein [Stenotrophomonas sp. GD03937]